MKNKILGIVLAMTFSVSVVAGCGENANNTDTSISTDVSDPSEASDSEVVDGDVEEATTIGTKLRTAFLDEVAKDSDMETIVNHLAQNEILSEQNMASMQVAEGYLNGFDDEIKGFKEGIMFSPMIGSIPFVGYVFNTDSPDALAEELEKHADLRWNVCTAADEMVIAIDGNYVFFVMAPESF